MIETAPFGRTGHASTRLIFGGAALGSMSQDRADRTIDLVRDAGINHFDTAASYGDSELRLAPWLATHRHEVFLATKTRERVGVAARAELELSLERLGLDQVDLIQLHNLVEDDEWETAHGAGGAVEAMVAARDEGLVRFIGVTGHGVRIPGMHLRSLREFTFDSVLLPYNLAMLDNPAYRDDVERLLAICAADNVAVQTIKSIARRRWSESYAGPRRSWYEPLDDDGAIERAVGYVLDNRQLFLNTTSDATKLPAIIAAASSGAPAPSDAELRADMATHAVTPLFDGADLERI